MHDGPEFLERLFSWLKRDFTDIFVGEVFDDEFEFLTVGVEVDEAGIVFFRPSSHDLVEREFFVRFVNAVLVGVAAEQHLASGFDEWLHPEFLSESRVAAVTGGPCARVVAFESA